jgi:penicillin-binding protein 2
MRNPSGNTLIPLAVTMTVALGAFALRLYDLQVVRYDEYATQSNKNHYALEPIRAVRGEVLAADGKTKLISNRIAYDLVYKGGEVRFWDRISRIAEIKDPLPEVGSGEEKVIKANLPDRNGSVVALSEWIAGQPALEIRTRTERIYPTRNSGTLYGYTRLATEEDEGHQIDDLTGASGIELSLDHLLSGKNGLKYIEVDAHGEALDERVDTEAQPGSTVTLTIETKLQAAAERAIAAATKDVNERLKYNGKPTIPEARGAVVVVRPQTGELLALATGPRFDPNLLGRRPVPKEGQKRLLDPGNPVYSRAVHRYPPGSTFKLLTSDAILEKYGNQSYTCVPWVRFGRVFRNWESVNRGALDVRGAIANSCDTWYYQAAIEFDPTNLANVIAHRAREMGFGSRTGLELPFEDPGFVAGPEGYAARGMEWNPGDGLSLSIGQLMEVTPIQIARMLSAIVNDGQMPQLTLVKAVNGKPVAKKPMTKVSGTQWKVLKEGMRQTVIADSGSARPKLGPDAFPIPTAGKTGSAQHGGADTISHAWYMGYGPYEKPEIAVVAFFENADHGYYAALNAVKRVMADYWGVKIDEESRILKALPPEEPKEKDEGDLLGMTPQ